MIIPKVIHYCWFGRHPLPELALKCISSWKKFLPDYDIKEWNEDNFDVNIIPYTREAYRLKKYAFVSDYARLWILYNYGGLYFDTDVEIVRPIYDIISRGPFMGMEATPNDLEAFSVAPGLGLGVKPGNELYNMLLKEYESRHFISWDGCITETIVEIVSSVMSNIGMVDFDNNIKICQGVFIYPSDFFCPMNYFTGALNITTNTRSIHHYKASWKSETKSLFCKIIKRIRFVYVRFT